MNEKPTTGSIYRGHEAITSLVLVHLKNKNITLRHCHSNQVYKRITQEFSRISADKYLKNITKKHNSEHIDLDCIYFNTKTGKFKIKFLFFIKSVLTFISVWSYFLYFILTAFFYKKKYKKPATLLFERVPHIQTNDEKFINFCQNGKIEPLKKATSIIIRTNIVPKIQNNTDLITYTNKHPIAYCIQHTLYRRQLLSILIKHFYTLFIFIKSIVISPYSALIGKDIAMINIVKFLNDHNIIASIIITTSAFQSQPIWMNGLINRKFKLHMVWYSQNFIPKVYKGESKPSNLPGAILMNVDEHWVWTNGFAQYLKDIGQKNKINIIGPILWFLKNKTPKTSTKERKIVVFDITPHNISNPFSCLKDYYSLDLMKRFVSDIVEICEELSSQHTVRLKVLLKHKRPISEMHSTEYINFIDRLIKNNQLELLNADVNTFSIIEECLLSISVPYTSTAYVASYLKKPSVYYDPYSDIVPIFDKNKFIDFASGYKELKNITEKALIYRLK